MSKHKLFLLDGMALAYRAHFAFINARLTNKEGLATGPIFGFANTIEKLMETETPTHVAVAWDTHAPTFRHKMDVNYKAQRPPQPDELRAGIPIIKEMLKLYGIPNLELDGYEADDIIGTLAYNAQAEDVDVFLVTPDKDFMQLVNEHVKMYKPLNNREGFDVVGIEGVEEYFGVKPDRVIDVLALIGDASDNIPGMPGVGKKTAPKLIEEYGSLENLLGKASEMKKSKLKENLMSFADQARLAYEMVTICTTVPNIPAWKDLEYKTPEKPKLAAFFERMQFRTLMGKYREMTGYNLDGQGDMFSSANESTISEPVASVQKLELSDVEYITVKNEAQLAEVVAALQNAEKFVFDTETTGIDALSADFLGISISVSPKKAFYIVLNSDTELSISQVREALSPIFADTGKVKIAHNLKYDYQVLSRYDFSLSQPIYDTMIAAFLVDCNQKVGMDTLSLKYLGYEPISIKSLIGTGKTQKTLDDIPLEEVSNYSCEDADITFQLYEVLKPMVDELNLTNLAESIEFPLIRILGDLEAHGVMVDLEFLEQFSKELGSDIEKEEKKIIEQAGEDFNLNSPAQLGQILFEKLKLPAGKKTKSGGYSTDEGVLSNLAVEFEIARDILEYRGLHKLRSTYVDAMPKLVDENARIHTSLNQHIAATGRLSSSNPNLQNIPIRTERGRQMRRAFVAPEGFSIISADYSQIELRVIAAISGDENMKQAFLDGEDIHARTAKEIFGLDSIEQVEREHRRKAKEVNFGIPYGVSAFGLAQRLGLSRSEGAEMIDAYFSRFPGIKTYIKDSIISAKDKGYAETLFGRRRPIPDINAKNGAIRAFAERTAINTPIQGSAADIIKLAMIKVDEMLRAEKLESKMILQIHDELLFEVPNEEADEMLPKIISAMETAADIGVPLKVEAAKGINWLEAH